MFFFFGSFDGPVGLCCVDILILLYGLCYDEMFLKERFYSEEGLIGNWNGNFGRNLVLERLKYSCCVMTFGVLGGVDLSSLL